MSWRSVAVVGVIASVWLVSAVDLSSQTTPTFEVVSIRRTDPSQGVNGTTFDQRPDGGITATNVPVTTLIGRAYPLLPTADMPEWARGERYDVRTRSSLSSATPADRLAMLRSLLADRFKLAVRIEPREQSAYVLTVARRDGRLGPGLTPVSTECPVGPPAPNVPPPLGPAPRPDLTAPPAPCTARIVGAVARDRQGDGKGSAGDLLEGEVTMAALAQFLQFPVSGMVVDRTGLKGTYRVAMNFSNRPVGPGPTPAPAANIPSLFVALEEQLGLKLESARVPIDTLVIERLERPTDN